MRSHCSNKGPMDQPSIRRSPIDDKNERFASINRAGADLEYEPPHTHARSPHALHDRMAEAPLMIDV